MAIAAWQKNTGKKNALIQAAKTIDLVSRTSEKKVNRPEDSIVREIIKQFRKESP